MLKNWFLIASVTFGVGFGTTLLLSKDAKLGAIAGAAGVPGVVLSVAMLKRQRQEEVEQQLFTARTTLTNLQQQEQAINQNIQQQQAAYAEATAKCQEIDRQFAALEMQQQGHLAAVNKLEREVAAKQTITDNLAIITAEKEANVDALESKLTLLHERQQVATASLLNQQEIEAEIVKFTAARSELMAEIEAQQAAKSELALAITQLQTYQTEIQDQIAEDKEICNKAEEYLQQVALESQDKREDCQELDILIKSKSAELNNIRENLANFQQQKTDAESAIRRLAIELQEVGEAILDQENVKQTLDDEIAQLSDNNAVMQKNLLAEQMEMVEQEIRTVEFTETEPITTQLNLDDSTWEQPEELEIRANLAEFDIQDLDITYLDVACPVPAAIDFDKLTTPYVAPPPAAVVETAEFDISNVDIAGLDIPTEYAVAPEFDLDDSIQAQLDSVAQVDMPEESGVDLELALQDLEITYIDLDVDLPSEPAAAMASLLEKVEEQPALAETKADQAAFDILDLDISGLDIPSLSEMMTFNFDESILAETKPDDSMAIDQLEVQWAADPTNWAASFVGNPHLQILQHIEEHGTIAHFEAAALLNDKKVAKQFAEKVNEYAELLPFAITIERSSNGNRYLKV
jgi:hypothetical protein